MLWTVLCFWLTGCAGKENAERTGSASENAQMTEPSSEEAGGTQTSGASEEGTSDPDKNAAAKEAYMDFLNGKGVVTTSDEYRRAEGVYNGNNLDYGTYSYQELKYAIAEEMMGDSAAHYTLLDIGGDGVEELPVLRFENENPNLLNWTGIIHYDSGKLTLTYSYEDGYRSEGELFSSGCLLTGGSGGAGVYGENCILFAEDGTANQLYESYEYWGNFAHSIYYQMGGSQNNPLEEKYSNLPSEFYINTYSDENGLKIYVKYSEDAEPEAHAQEEAFVKELTEMGLNWLMRKWCWLLRNTPFLSLWRLQRP